mmetsp:Transcript_15351/g.27379  ORF Transcript_15351/g.27379 Transcript_15351/m.27379 type:complete len:372 (-) Transcript_15351:168-1283(-)
MQQSEKRRAEAREAAKRAAEEKKRAEAALAREHSSYFSFSDVSWIASRLEKQAALYGIGIIEFEPLIEGWLQHRFPNRLQTPTMDSAALEEAISLSQVDTSEPISFLELLKIMSMYTEVHLEKDPKAGFSTKSFNAIKTQFDPYDKTGAGLKTRELWLALSSCGVQMAGQEDQHWMIHMVKKVDKDDSGTIDVGEFCQLLRKVRFRMDADSNARECQLIMKSNIPVKEVEEWATLFRRYDAHQKNSLTLSQLHQALSAIGIKWGIEGTDKLMTWLREEDENADNEIDFGEFCCLIARIVAEDFQGIRSAIKGSSDGLEDNASPSPDKPRWTSDKRIKLAWDEVHEPLSPTMAPRASLEFEAFGEDPPFSGA